MEKFLWAVSTAFLRAFGANFIAYAPGILAAPDLHAALNLSVAALATCISAGLRAIQVFIPQLSWKSVLPNVVAAAWADAFTIGFTGAFLEYWQGWLAAPDWSAWHAALVGAVVGALTVAFRALQGFATKGESPAPDKGITDPALT